MRYLGWFVVLALGCSSTSNDGTSGTANGGASGVGGALSVAGTSSGGASAGSSGSSGTGGSLGGGASGTSGNGGALSAGNGGASGGGGASGMSGGSGGSGGASSNPGKQVLIWVWMNYKDDLATVEAHASSFTHVSPALYQMNYDYQSGPPMLLNGNDQFSGLSSSQIAQELHMAGLKCVPLVYAGAGNSGTDQGIQNVLNDSPAGTQQNLITSMVNEAKTKGYDGWNLDWEVGNTGYNAYGMKLISFLGKFKQALNAEGMQLSLDLGDWYVRQCGGDGLVDLAALGDSVDLAIMEDYAGTLGNPGSACPMPAPTNLNCDKDFTAQLQVMCNAKPAHVSIGVIAPGTSAFASQAFQAVADYGFTGVALWPGNMGFLAQDNFPQGQSWYSVFSDFLAQK
ncbi:MAG TPA: hypothetical protein VK745_13650 [Polyangiaceae bacterium]|jgi:hypothetical protein|nr:hypothetical protein [Polyangiaceae bacterium]